jgi:hypothetical protein
MVVCSAALELMEGQELAIGVVTEERIVVI